MPIVKLSRPSPMTTAAIADKRTREPLVLKPGENLVTDEQLQEMHSDPVIAAWRAEGWLSYADPVAAPAEGETLKGDGKPDPKAKKTPQA